MGEGGRGEHLRYSIFLHSWSASIVTRYRIRNACNTCPAHLILSGNDFTKGMCGEQGAGVRKASASLCACVGAQSPRMHNIKKAGKYKRINAAYR